MKNKILLLLCTAALLSFSACNKDESSLLNSNSDIPHSSPDLQTGISDTDSTDISGDASDSSSEDLSSADESSQIDGSLKDDSSNEDIPLSQTAMYYIEKINSDNVYFKTGVDDSGVIYDFTYCRLGDKAYIFNTLNNTEIIIQGNNVYQTNAQQKLYALVSESSGSEMISQDAFGYYSFGYKYQSGSSSLVDGEKIYKEHYIIDYYGSNINSYWYFSEDNALLKIEEDNLMNNFITVFDSITLDNAEEYTEILEIPSDYTEVSVSELSESFAVPEADDTNTFDSGADM